MTSERGPLRVTVRLIIHLGASHNTTVDATRVQWIAGRRRWGREENEEVRVAQREKRIKCV